MTTFRYIILLEKNSLELQADDQDIVYLFRWINGPQINSPQIMPIQVIQLRERRVNQEREGQK